MTRRILVTGALGHIGSSLIHNLEPREFAEVRMLDNLSTQRYVSLFNLPKGVNFSFIRDDLLNVDLDELTKDVGVVVHLAAITDATSSFERRAEVEQVNYEGTKRLAEACIKADAGLLFPSTTSVYGSQSEVVDESCSIEDLKPQSPYAEYKLKSEQMLKKLETEGLRFIICRLGTIFGTSVGMRFHTAVNKFCWQAVLGQPLTVWETAMYQKRPYLGVNDAVCAMKLIIQSGLFDGETYNIVSSNNTVEDIVECIRKTLPDLKVELVNTEIMNQLSYEVLSTKIENVGFEPVDNLTVGISETITLFDSLLST